MINFDKIIEQRILEEEEKVEKKSSTSLTASILGWALQWQVLKGLGIPQQEKEIYVIKKFIRGRQVENYIAELLSFKDRQKEVEYKKVIGLIDGIYDFENYGEIPIEIKSVANSKFKHIVNENKADESHLLQAGLYALALKKEYFAICYVSSDDLRTMTFIKNVNTVYKEIEKIISDFNYHLEKKIVPEFKPKYEWQKKDSYNPYPEFKSLSADEIKRLLKTKYKIEL